MDDSRRVSSACTARRGVNSLTKINRRSVGLQRTSDLSRRVSFAAASHITALIAMGATHAVAIQWMATDSTST